MALFQQHPIHVRKKIALGITIGIAIILVVVMIFVYSSQKNTPPKNSGASTAWGHFYGTLIENTQSFFSKERAIIGK